MSPPDRPDPTRIQPPPAASTVSHAAADEWATRTHEPGRPGGAAPPAGAAPGPARYDLLREVGRGGMGVVFEARDRELNRTVALKMVLHGRLAEPGTVARFLAEAEALAALQHPHVVQVFDRGEHDGLPFFAMEFCPGGSLAARARDAPLPPREAAAVVERLARGVQAAHDRGILHRDLKPENVLFDAAGVPKLSDFGLAKRLADPAVGAGLTMTGAVMGTPSYMAPEQAAGRGPEVGPAADVYGLGAVLYRLLTGRPPFVGPSTHDIAAQVVNDDPVAARVLQRGVPRDLETICHHCLRKNPRQRYASPAALADDLRRFLDGRPVQARPVGPLEKACKWARRNPGPTTAAALLTAVLVLAGLGAAWFTVEQRRLRQAADERAAAEAAARDEAEGNLYVKLIGEADRLAADNDPDGAAALLAQCPPARRGWEWYYLDGVARGRRPVAPVPRQATGRVAFSPDGRHAAATAVDGHVRVWDTRDWTLEWSYLNNPLLIKPIMTMSVAFAPDPADRRLAFSDALGTLFLVDLGNGHKVTQFRHPGRPAFAAAVAFSPDGRYLASGSWNGTGQVWDTARNERRCLLEGHGREVNGLAYSPDGGTIATVGSDRTIRLWDPATGALKDTIDGHPSAVYSLAFHPRDPAVLATGAADGTVRVWDLTGRTAVQAFEAHAGPVWVLAFSPDGRRLASAGYDKVVRLWDSRNWAHVLDLRGHADMVWGLAWDPDGSRLVSGGFGGARDQTVLVWEGPRRVPPAPEAAVTAPARLNRVAFSPTGPGAVAAGFDGNLYVWDRDAGGSPRAVPAHDGEVVFGLAFSPDGTRYASAGWDRSVRVFDAKTHHQVHRLPLGWNGQAVAFSPDGRTLAAAEWNGQVSLWDPGTGAKVRDLVGRLDLGYPATSLAFSPDGMWLAAGSADRTVAVWRCEGWERAATLRGLSGSVACIDFDPSSRRLVTGSWDGEVWEWDLAGKVRRRLPAHANRVNAVAFSPDGGWLATAGEDGRVRLFDWARPEAPAATFEHRGPAWGVAFVPDGRHLASAGWDKAVRFWALPGRTP